jgi:hypothetical protein
MANSFLKICGKDVKVQGRLVRIGQVEGDCFVTADPKQMVDALRKAGTRVDLFTFLQKLPETSPQYAYPMVLENLAVLPISTFENWWTNQIRSYPRNRARQAEKRGVVIREVAFDDVLLRGICEIYNESPIRQGKPFAHYGMTVDRAREYAGTFLDHSIFIGAFLGETMIGFIKLITDETRTQAHLIHILSMVQHKDKAPNNALIAQAIRSCASRGISQLIYERFTYGKREGDSLTHFKEINGFQRVDLPRYYVPLTPLGRIAFRLGLHQRLVDRVPESLASRFREFRRAWYSRKFESVAEA